MSYSEDQYLNLAGIQHFSFCPRQWALIHVERLWEDNSLTILGQIVHEKAHDLSLIHIYLEEHSDWILEHYSDFENELINASTNDNLQKQEELQEYELRTERWDSPIIITSLVHFMDTDVYKRQGVVISIHAPRERCDPIFLA